MNEQESTRPPAASAALPGLHQDRTRKLRALIAEDHDMVREGIVRIVRYLGHDIFEACDGLEAVEAMQSSSFDLLLLDLSMPRMGGLEVIDWVQENPQLTCGMKIIVTSANAHDARDALHAAGISLILPKPFRPEELQNLITEHGMVP